MSDYFRPSTWRSYDKKNCSNCKADCCRLPVEVNLRELITMKLAHEEELEEVEDLVKRLKKVKIIHLFDRKRSVVTLAQKVDSSCIFLDEKFRCSIYDLRPQTCINFPQIGPRPSYCPWNLNSLK